MLRDNTKIPFVHRPPKSSSLPKEYSDGSHLGYECSPCCGSSFALSWLSFLKLARPHVLRFGAVLGLLLVRQHRHLVSCLASMYDTSKRPRSVLEENQERILFLKRPKSNQISTDLERMKSTSFQTNHRISKTNDHRGPKFVVSAVTTPNFVLCARFLAKIDFKRFHLLWNVLFMRPYLRSVMRSRCEKNF